MAINMRFQVRRAWYYANLWLRKGYRLVYSTTIVANNGVLRISQPSPFRYRTEAATKSAQVEMQERFDSQQIKTQVGISEAFYEDCSSHTLHSNTTSFCYHDNDGVRHERVVYGDIIDFLNRSFWIDDLAERDDGTCGGIIWAGSLVAQVKWDDGFELHYYNDGDIEESQKAATEAADVSKTTVA